MKIVSVIGIIVVLFCSWMQERSETRYWMNATKESLAREEKFKSLCQISQEEMARAMTVLTNAVNAAQMLKMRNEQWEQAFSNIAGMLGVDFDSSTSTNIVMKK